MSQCSLCVYAFSKFTNWQKKILPTVLRCQGQGFIFHTVLSFLLTRQYNKTSCMNMGTALCWAVNKLATCPCTVPPMIAETGSSFSSQPTQWALGDNRMENITHSKLSRLTLLYPPSLHWQKWSLINCVHACVCIYITTNSHAKDGNGGMHVTTNYMLTK